MTGVEGGGSGEGCGDTVLRAMETTTKGSKEEGKDENNRERGLPVLVLPAQFRVVHNTRAPRYITYKSTPRYSLQPLPPPPRLHLPSHPFPLSLNSMPASLR